MARQFFQRTSHATEAVSLRFALVVVLLMARGPSAIGRFVVAVVVNAVNRVFGRRLETHIGMEVREGIKPSLTDGDASTTVVFVSGGGHSGASPDHVSPSSIFRRVSHAMRGFGFQHLSFDAAARMRPRKVRALDRFDRSARALAEIARVSWVQLVHLKDGQSAPDCSGWKKWHGQFYHTSAFRVSS